MRTALIALLAALSFNAGAQAFPERPVTIITPYAAGGGLDVITRAVAQRLTALWGQQVNVENRPGAGSTVGTTAAAKARPDGYTLLTGSTPLGVAPAVYANLAYDVKRDFAPLSMIGTTPEVLVVNPALNVNSAGELAALAKGGRKLNFGSAGSGTLAHLAAASFNTRAALGGTHIPYKGSNPALTDLLGGQIDWLFDTPTAVLPHVRSGKLKALAVAAAQRSPQLANVPTLAEAGYADGLNLILYTSDVLPNLVPLAEIFQQQAAAAGINITLEVVPADSFFSETAVNEAFITTGWLGRPTDEILNLVFRSTSPLNEAKFANEGFDQLLDEARQAQDLTERTKLYQEAQQLVATEGGHMIAMHINEATIVSNAIANFPARSVEHIEWYEITKSE